jgi:integrase
MARPKGSLKQPSYRLHRSSGQACCTIAGKVVYLGTHGSRESKEAYARAMLEWAAVGTTIDSKGNSEIEINELVAMFYRSLMQENPKAEHHYKYAMRLLKEHYGKTPAIEFGPLKLKALRHSLIGRSRAWKRQRERKPLCRFYINHITQHVKGLFKWAVENEVLPERCYHGLRAVTGLKKGRTDARESEQVLSVPAEDLKATRELVPPTIAAMMDLQLLTAARPGEICAMRVCDLNMSGDVWTYIPQSHKTEHLGAKRVIRIGPKAQEVLRPYLSRNIASQFV